MTILSRFVIGEFLKVFLVSLCALTGLMLLVGVVLEARRQNLGLLPIAQLLPYLLPESLQYAIPGTTLFAACIVFGRMAANNEIVALKSLGLSPWVVLRPVMLLAVVVSVLSVVLHEVAVRWGRAGAQRVILQSLEDIVYGMLRSEKSYSTNRFSINVKDVDGHILVRPTVVLESSRDQPRVTITAHSAELMSNPDEETLRIEFHDGAAHVGENVLARFPGTEHYDIPLSDASRRDDKLGKVTAVPFWNLADARRQAMAKTELTERELAAEAAYQMITGQFEALSATGWHGNSSRLARDRSRLSQLYLEPHRRWSNGLVCLCFALVGAPMAIRLRSADYLTAFFACFLPILIVYYPLLAVSLDHAKGGTWPAWSIWLPNGLLTLWGLWLVRRVLRY